MTDARGTSRILTLVFTDLADSTALKTQRGDQAVGELITRHRAHVRRLAAESGGRIIDWAGDGCLRHDLPHPATTTPASDRLTVPGFGDRPAIAVLPFDNLSGDAAQEYFADGLAEDLITRLSLWRSFPVIARNSSFVYKGKAVDLKQVSADLGVRYVVEGSVRKAGDRVRIAAQLIDATSGQHVWAETYDRELTDVFAVQDEISSAIAASLVGDLNRAEAERAQQRVTENLEAWSLYQLGLQRGDRLTREDNIEARRLFERAVALDPRFATALARVAFTDLWDVILGFGDAPEQKVSGALETARRAVELDPRDAFAHGALGFAYIEAGDARNGLDEYQRGLDLNPSMPEAWVGFGWAKLSAGDPEGCVAANQQAQRLSPQGPMMSLAYDNMALAYWELGRYEESLEATRRLMAARPGYFFGPVYIAMSSVALGRIDEARAAITEARRLQPDLSLEMIQRGLGVSRPEVDARRNAALRQAGLE
jgi:TolB-like protein